MHHKVRSYSILQQAIAISTAKLSKLLAEVILKSRMIYQSLLVLSALVISSTTANHAEGSPTISPVVIPPSTGGEGACPSNEVRAAARQNLTLEVRTLLMSLLATKAVPECGEGQWLPVASLNMTDPSEHCPGDWMEYNTPIRLVWITENELDLL